MSRRAVIVGVATSDYPHLPDMSEGAVHAQAAERALADAGLTFDDVDGYASAGYHPLYSVAMSEYLGLRPMWLDETNIGGASFEVHLEHAARAIEAGDCEVVLITYGSIQLSSMGRQIGGGGGGGGGVMAPQTWDGLWGNSLVGSYALAARRHMAQYGTTSDQLAEVAVTMRRHAGFNPLAQYRDPLTVEDVLASKLVADPLHKFDCCVVSDGGGACVVTTEERARDLPSTPVHVLGAAHTITHALNVSQSDDLTVSAAARSGPKALQRAGVALNDVDTLQLYDSFTITVVLTLEGLGFCDPGEGGPFVQGGRLAFDGPLPTNTDGGGLSACHPGMRGMFLLVEAVRQLRGEAGATQVPGAEVALVHGTGGYLSTGATVILGTHR
jgi:acetyl-CoA acetyltransferase